MLCFISECLMSAHKNVISKTKHILLTETHNIHFYTTDVFLQKVHIDIKVNIIRSVPKLINLLVGKRFVKRNGFFNSLDLSHPTKYFTIF